MRASWKNRLEKAECVATPGSRTVVLRIAYDSEGPDWDSIEPFAGVKYVYVLRQKAPSAEAWAQHVQQRFQSERRSHGLLSDADPTTGD
jgi:hypothetical protein